jgi:hypothetical protein
MKKSILPDFSLSTFLSLSALSHILLLDLGLESSEEEHTVCLQLLFLLLTSSVHSSSLTISGYSELESREERSEVELLLFLLSLCWGRERRT